jgi:hypothetical protein
MNDFNMPQTVIQALTQVNDKSPKRQKSGLKNVVAVVAPTKEFEKKGLPWEK